jgi:Amt family ammonium transporter
LYTQVKYGKPEIVLTLAGIVGGMVSACAGGAWLPSWAAAITGLVAGVIVPLAVIALELRGRLDDPLGVIAIHIVGGAWGTIAAGIFIPIPLAPRGRGEQILIQAVGVIGIAIFAAAVSAALFLILRATVGLRSKEADEFDGLDLAEHDIGAYPDFQQNSIKSYHLREA